VAGVVAGPPVPRDRLWELGHGGDQPTDTTHRFAAATGRVIVLRHPAPDHSVFALLTVPASDRTDSLTVRLSPVPEQYAVAIAGDDAPSACTTLTLQLRDPLRTRRRP
jgi:hypothetical protein